MKPYHNVLRFIDLPVDAACAQFALPAASQLAPKSSSGATPVFSNKLVFAAALVDASIRLFVLPLLPPGPDAVDSSQWDVSVIKISSPNSHRDLITGISMAITADTRTGQGEDDQKSRSRSRGRPASTSEKALRDWSVSIASTSCTGSGLLLIHQIPLGEDGRPSPDAEDLLPIQRHFLRANLSKCKLSFNPAPFPAERHLNLLIGLPNDGCVRLYQVRASSSSRGRRDSTATADSLASSTKSSQKSYGQQGKFLITMYTNFENIDHEDEQPHRKCILDAAWVLGGRAILVLLENGEWGVWDLEAAGPTSSSATQNLLKGRGNVSGLQGGSTARFAIKGTVKTVRESSSNRASKDLTAAKSGNLVPLTSHTKNIRSGKIFQETSSTLSSAVERSETPYGAICTEQSAADPVAGSKVPDECVTLCYQGHLTYIASLLTYWRAEARGQGTLDASVLARPVKLPAVRFGGEHPHSLGYLFPRVSSGGLAETRSAVPDLFLATAHRLLFSVGPLDAEADNDLGTTTTTPSVLMARNASTDQVLLDRRQLDVEGMDQILDGMEGGVDTHPLSRSMYLALGADRNGDEPEDVEMNMGTPTPRLKIRSSRLRSSFNPRESRGLRKSEQLFT